MNKEYIKYLWKIAARAEAMQLLRNSRIEFVMILEFVHNDIGLRVEDFFNGDEVNFTHDVIGIQKNFDGATKKLKNFFLPRYAKNE